MLMPLLRSPMPTGPKRRTMSPLTGHSRFGCPAAAAPGAVGAWAAPGENGCVIGRVCTGRAALPEGGGGGGGITPLLGTRTPTGEAPVA